MKRELLDIICCPTCKEDLKLVIKKEENNEIIEGTLICKKCNSSYTIEDGIPNLLPKK
ncbi:MAG: Trm112 family protein [Thermoplasmata archaeon]|nr:MAG: Trm112 family protein [Thermoplasmata archaeon]RLF36202.1 MAG: Trm112 family protein [Thermoplasmata archaeon]